MRLAERVDAWSFVTLKRVNCALTPAQRVLFKPRDFALKVTPSLQQCPVENDGFALAFGTKSPTP